MSLLNWNFILFVLMLMESFLISSAVLSASSTAVIASTSTLWYLMQQGYTSYYKYWVCSGK
ncbi:hypothetical protein [uncultured Mesonia sp.]|uniref:hypothetical protein n=1 Tax=uncultured Mesonia sp. TaxID=399731 RepID=UPI00374EAC46